MTAAKKGLNTAMAETPRIILRCGEPASITSKISMLIFRSGRSPIAGVSGSGKSSPALGVLYAEGSRRYLEALSTYTRRRLTQAAKADVDQVLYIPAALALHQRPRCRGSARPLAPGLNC